MNSNQGQTEIEMKQNQIENVEIEYTEPKQQSLKYVSNSKQNIPPQFAQYADKIKKIRGNSYLSLAADTIAFAAGFAAVTLFSVTVGKLSSMDFGAKAFLSACPTITGSFLRLPFGVHIGKTGGKKGTLFLLTIASLGMIYLTILTANINLAKVKTDGNWVLLILGGLLAGFGIATFPMIINVLFWFDKTKAGTSQAYFGGIGNIAPGFFALIMPLILDAWSLTGCYIIWLIILVVATIIVFFILENSPFHQLKNEHHLSADEATKIAVWLGQDHCPKGPPDLWGQHKKWENWVLCWDYFISFGGFLALNGYLFVFHQDYLGVTNSKHRGYYVSAWSIMSSICRSISGPFTDKFGGYATTLVGFVIMTAGFVIYATSTRSECFTNSAYLEKYYQFENGNQTFQKASDIPKFKTCKPHADTWQQYLGLEVLLTISIGLANAGIYKWIPLVAPGKAGPVGGMVGGWGATGGFIIPNLFLSPFARGKTTGRSPALAFLWMAGFCIVSIIVSFILNRVLEQRKKSQQASKV